MATRAQPIKVGPWPGGINTLSDQSAVDDNEAVDIVNFDIDTDGSLKSRPSLVFYDTSIKFSIRILGTYSLLNGTHYVIFSGTDPAGANPCTLQYNINTGVYGTISNNFAAMAMVQYQNKAWLVANPNQATNGGYWDGASFTTVATMPKGCTACTYKERMFIGTGDQNTTNPGMIYYSKPTDFTEWSDPLFAGNFNVNNGDGQSIRKIYSYQGSIVTFKSRSTYVSAYESDPLKIQTQIVSNSVGIDGLDCMTENQSILYVLSGTDAYAINNWIWEQLNVKTPFPYSDSHYGNWTRHCCVSSVGNRVIFRYYDSHMVFNTNTHTWTKWASSYTPDQFVKSPLLDMATGIDTYIGGNYLKSTAGAGIGTKLFIMRDTITATDFETFTCTLKTKVFSFDEPQMFKRLMWWGVDLLSKSKISVTVSPVTYGLPVRWNQLPPRTWAQMSPGTWGSPLDIVIDVTDSVDIQNTHGIRMFVRYLKSLRFRQLQFVISSVLDGTTTTGPLQIYSITPYVVSKQLVPQKVN